MKAEEKKEHVIKFIEDYERKQSEIKSGSEQILRQVAKMGEVEKLLFMEIVKKVGEEGEQMLWFEIPEKLSEKEVEETRSLLNTLFFDDMRINEKGYVEIGVKKRTMAFLKDLDFPEIPEEELRWKPTK